MQNYRSTYVQFNIFEPLTPLGVLSSFQYAAWFSEALTTSCASGTNQSRLSVQMSVLTHICIAAVLILWAVMYMREELDFSVFEFALVWSLSNLQVVLHRVERPWLAAANFHLVLVTFRVQTGVPVWIGVLYKQREGAGRVWTLDMIFLRHNHNTGYYFRMRVVFSSPKVVMAWCWWDSRAQVCCSLFFPGQYVICKLMAVRMVVALLCF